MLADAVSRLVVLVRDIADKFFVTNRTHVGLEMILNVRRQFVLRPEAFGAN